jgi:hypothetical protein
MELKGASSRESRSFLSSDLNGWQSRSERRAIRRSVRNRLKQGQNATLRGPVGQEFRRRTCCRFERRVG